MQDFIGTVKLSIKSPSLSPPIPSFSPIHQVMRFNAQGLSVIIVVVEVGAVNLSLGAVEALRKKERGDETQFGGKSSLGPSYFVPCWNFHSQLCI